MQLEYQRRILMGTYETYNTSGMSGDYRPVHVCASGEIIVCSGLHVVADVEVVASSGLQVQISGQHVFVESGVWLADTSGTTQNVLLHGYHPASGIWVPLAVTLSGCLATTYCSSGGIFD